MLADALSHAEVLLERSCEAGDLRALKLNRRGRVRLFLEVNYGRLARLLSPDDDRQLYRRSEYGSEDELRTAFARVALAFGR